MLRRGCDNLLRDSIVCKRQIFLSDIVVRGQTLTIRADTGALRVGLQVECPGRRGTLQHVFRVFARRFVHLIRR